MKLTVTKRTGVGQIIYAVEDERLPMCIEALHEVGALPAPAIPSVDPLGVATHPLRLVDGEVIYIRPIRAEETAYRPVWQFDLIRSAAAQGRCFAAKDIPGGSAFCLSHIGRPPVPASSVTKDGCQ